MINIKLNISLRDDKIYIWFYEIKVALPLKNEIFFKASMLFKNILLKSLVFPDKEMNN